MSAIILFTGVTLAFGYVFSRLRRKSEKPQCVDARLYEWTR